MSTMACPGNHPCGCTPGLSYEFGYTTGFDQGVEDERVRTLSMLDQLAANYAKYGHSSYRTGKSDAFAQAARLIREETKDE
jgi:hypothetical protein